MTLKNLCLLLLLVLSMAGASNVKAQTCAELDGAYVIAQDSSGMYLGFFGSRFAAESIMNQFGTYGSQFSSSSVRNNFGTYGSEFSSYSANSDFASSPPIIYKFGQPLYFLSTNSIKSPRVTLAEIDASCVFSSVVPAGGNISLPSPPSSILVQDGQSTEVLEVAWNAGSGANSYNVYYSTSNSNYLFLGNTPLLYASITGLEQGINYYVAVTSVNASGESSTYVYDTGYLATAPRSFTVTPSSGLGGSVTPSAAQTIAEGATAKFTLIPDSGNVVDSIGGTCGGGINGNIYTTNAVTADCSVIATFEQASTAPPAPTITAVESEDSALLVRFTLANDGGSPIISYTVTCGDQSASGPDSPITVLGLTNDQGYSCSVVATNAVGSSQPSAPVSGTPEEAAAAGLPIWLLYEATKE